MLVTVPSGHVGVLWKRFRGGTQLDPRFLKDEGLRIILPWDRIFLYSLRLQTTSDVYNAISKDGVNLNATINIRYRLKHDAVPQLHQSIGPEYVERLIRPEIGNRMREIIAQYTAEEVYSTKRQEIQAAIREHTEAMLGQKMIQRAAEESEYGESYRLPLSEMINLYDALILSLELPAAVVRAINNKVEQYYLVQEYTFRVEREKKESERKQIEAQGIRAFQQTVAQGISDSYVRWRGIEATLQLAQSNNSKIVIIGNSKDGLPIILGNVDVPPTPPPAGPAKPDGENAPVSNRPITDRLTESVIPPLEKRPEGNLSTSAQDTPRETRPAAAEQPSTPPHPDRRSEAPAPQPGPRASSGPLQDVEAWMARVRRLAQPAAPTGQSPPPGARDAPPKR
jgi:regulator of protease activity HflC (stomatin/prohibitin superfamily)